MKRVRRAVSRSVEAAIRRLPPARQEPARQRVRRLTRPAWFRTLRSIEPLSHKWGYDRGTPVDRYYIERFLAAHRDDIRGRVLEVKDADYTRRFGTGVTASDVLDVDGGNPRATIVADLAHADAVEGDAFDCFVLTQTLQLIAELEAAVFHSHRLLRPRGVLLATVPCASRLVAPAEEDYDHWRFTPASCRLLFGSAFGRDALNVRGHGNLLTTVAFLTGMAVEDLGPAYLEVDDPLYPLVVTVRAVKR